MSETVSRRDDVGRHAVRTDLRGTVIEGERVSLVRWVIPAGQPATRLHHHDVHEQFTVVAAGAVETVVGEERLHLEAGDVCRIKPGVLHGETIALGGVDAVLIDVFEPAREDYVSAARADEHSAAP